MPPPPKIDVDLKKVSLDGSTTLFQCFSNDHLRYEAEYGLKRGTTTNVYLLQDGNDGILVDVPRKEYMDVFAPAIAKEKCTIKAIAITHLNPDIVETLAQVLRDIRPPAEGKVTLILTNPALKVLRSKLEGADDGESLLDRVEIKVPKADDALKIGRRDLQFITITTPRYPDMMAVYERSTRRLFSSCFFSAHVNPQEGVTGNEGTDRKGWAGYSSDWQHFFACMFAPCSRQASAALDKLDITVASGSAGSPGLLLQLKKLFSSAPVETPKGPERPVATILPRHGPVIRQSVTQIIGEYGRWLEEQSNNLKAAKVAVLYASAYGNTAALAQTISRGITKAGVGVEMVNLEQVPLAEAEEVLKSSQGFCIGSPTLGGHMPTQVSAMLGSILRSPDAKRMPCGVYGSFGWSGEAVDDMHSSLNNAGFQHAFKPIKVQFRPDAKAVQLCEESGTDLAQTVLKNKRKEQKSTAQRASASIMSNVSDAQQAMGRVVGSLSVVTCKDGEAESAMLASWISQASFDPPGVTVAVKKDRAVESFMVNGNTFNVNILKQGEEGPVMKALLKPFGPGEDRFGGVKHHRSEDTDCVVLEDAVSVLECTVADRMDAGDHYIVYGSISSGKVLAEDSLSAVHHRKSGATY